MKFFRLPPVLFVLWLTIGCTLQARWPLALHVPRIAGLVLVVAAAALMTTALVTLHRHRTAIEPWHRPSALVTNGVFAISRNPIYVGLILTLLGLAVAADALWVAIAAAMLWLTLDVVVVRGEEQIVHAAFGEEYDAYRRRTCRWLGVRAVLTELNPKP